MNKVKRIAGIACFVSYPVFIFLSVAVFRLPIYIVGLGMLILGTVAFFCTSGKKRITPAIMGCVAIIFFLTKSESVIRLYPVWITFAMLWLFLTPLIQGNCIIYTFASMIDKSIAIHPGNGEIREYCRVWNIVWVCFFCISAAVNICLVFYGSRYQWALYNGLISYILQACMFTAQFAVNFFFNRAVDKKYSFDRKKAVKKNQAQKECKA